MSTELLHNEAWDVLRALAQEVQRRDAVREALCVVEAEAVTAVNEADEAQRVADLAYRELALALSGSRCDGRQVPPLEELVLSARALLPDGVEGDDAYDPDPTCPLHGERLRCTESDGYPDWLRDEQEAGRIMWFCPELGCDFSAPDMGD